jgi:hypothetical protein
MVETIMLLSWEFVTRQNFLLCVYSRFCGLIGLRDLAPQKHLTSTESFGLSIGFFARPWIIRA